jgi:LacI family transcriptional regulator
MRITIKDVAHKVGVNPSTVSRVLNGDSNLSIREETRNRILEAIQEMGYRPDPIARSLRMKTSDAIGMLIPDITNPFFPEIIKGAETAASEKGLSLILCNTDENSAKEKDLVRFLIDRRVDGILLFSSRLEDETLVEVEKSGIPFVLVNRGSRSNSGPHVVVDNSQGAQLAVQHLIRLGHRRIAHISGFLYTETGLERFEGYRKSLNAAGLPFVSEYMVEAGFAEQKGYTAMQKLLSVSKPPTAVFAANDLMAMGAMTAVIEKGLRIPEDLSIVGFDDIWVARRITPSLTTIRIPLNEMGYLAVQMIADKIKKNTLINERVILPPELVIRSSTSPVAKDY